MEWKEVWLSNYLNQTEAAKNIDEQMKKNYKGHKYVPWAIMVRWLYMMDDKAELEVLSVPNVEHDFSDSSIVFRDTVMVEKSMKEDYTRIAYNSLFVKVRCKFLGKEFVEVYPIQDNAYNAPNYVDSNMVNKAIQRAKAKVISLATGLGFQLYENGDLQFEDDSKEDTGKKTITKKVNPPVKEDVKVEEEVKATVKKENSDLDFSDLILSKMKDGDADMISVLQLTNPSLIRGGKKPITEDMSKEDLDELLDSLSNKEQFLKMFMKRYEDKKKGKK